MSPQDAVQKLTLEFAAFKDAKNEEEQRLRDELEKKRQEEETQLREQTKQNNLREKAQAIRVVEAAVFQRGKEAVSEGISEMIREVCEEAHRAAKRVKDFQTMISENVGVRNVREKAIYKRVRGMPVSGQLKDGQVCMITEYTESGCAKVRVGEAQY